MKKILTVSLVAVMAVSAAHANIASTKYVDDKETALNAAIALKADSSTVTALDGAYKQADTALGGRIDTLSGTVTANKTVTDKTQEDLDALEATVAGLTSDTGILSGLDLDAVQSEGKAIVSVSQADGKVSASVGTIGTAGIDDSAVTTAKIANANVTAAKLSEDAKALFDAAGSAAAAQAAAIAASDSKGSAAAAQAAAIEAAAADAAAKVKALADGQVATNTAGVAANTAKFADYSTTAQMNAELAKKQDKLTAGNNITIGADGKTISADVVNSTDGLTKDQLATAIPSVSMVEGLISDSNADTATTVGELSDLTTSAKGNIVAAINEVDANADAAQSTADSALSKANAAVVANAAITAGTGSVITYDAKGLVISGRALVASDIPTIEQSQVNGLGASLTGATNAALQGIADAATGTTDGVWTLTMKVKGDTKTFGWELISR